MVRGMRVPTEGGQAGGEEEATGIACASAALAAPAPAPTAGGAAR